MFWCKHAITKKHVSEYSWSSGKMILSILAHLAHLAQFYFSLIFSAINTCSWFDLKDNWWQKLGEKWSMFTTFFLTATAAITGINAYNLLFIHAESHTIWKTSFLNLFQKQIAYQKKLRSNDSYLYNQKSTNRPTLLRNHTLNFVELRSSLMRPPNILIQGTE